MANEPPSLTITSAKLGFVMSIFAVLGVGYSATSLVLDNKFRISALEVSYAALTEANKGLFSELALLRGTINELNLTLKEVQVTQRIQK